jgi:hypothetical protein
MKKKILFGLLAIFLFIQIFQPDREPPVTDPDKDIFAHTEAPESVAQLIKTACYDCHSNQVNYPWYAYISPASWWLSNHVKEGREELNFSEWGDYPTDRKDHKLEEGIEVIEGEIMPLPSYTWLHRDANFTDAERAELVDWFKNVRSQLIH